jgi:hypothetical protein
MIALLAALLSDGDADSLEPSCLDADKRQSRTTSAITRALPL